MGLIIKKIQKLMVGRPTVSDKYGVQGGMLAGTVNAVPGDVLVFAANAGEYKVPTTTLAVADIAGIVLGSNVKLVNVYPAGSNLEASVCVGEGLDLVTSGYIAVALTDAVEADIKEGAEVKCILNTANKFGKLTTSSVVTGTAVPGWTFTGIYENHGTAAEPKFVAEIKIA